MPEVSFNPLKSCAGECMLKASFSFWLSLMTLWLVRFQIQVSHTLFIRHFSSIATYTVSFSMFFRSMLLPSILFNSNKIGWRVESIHRNSRSYSKERLIFVTSSSPDIKNLTVSCTLYPTDIAYLRQPAILHYLPLSNFPFHSPTILSIL